MSDGNGQHRLLIRDGSVLTASGWLQPGFVLIEGEFVAAVGAGAPPEDLAADEVITVPHMAVLPGMLNGHTHLSQTFMRGLGGGRPLMRWLKERIWPLQAVLSPEIMRLAALLGLVENLRCGVTEVVNHHKVATTHAHTDVVLDAAQSVGLRLTLARGWVDCGTNAEDVESILADLERLFERWNGAADGRINISNGPLAAWRCSKETLRKTRAMALRYGASTHMHVSETRDEVEMCECDHQLRPVSWLESIGILGRDTQIVHGIWLEEQEIDLLEKNQSTVVLCPVSNGAIGSGIAPISAYYQRNISIRLGTDGPASNDTQDIWETVKAALCFSNASTQDPTIVSPSGALAMGLGRGTRIAEDAGVEVGMTADLIVVNLNHVRAVPVHDVTSALALSTHGSDVETVIVGGKLLMKEGHVLVLDEDELLNECRHAAAWMRKEAGLE